MKIKVEFENKEVSALVNLCEDAIGERVEMHEYEDINNILKAKISKDMTHSEIEINPDVYVKVVRRLKPIVGMAKTIFEMIKSMSFMFADIMDDITPDETTRVIKIDGVEVIKNSPDKDKSEESDK